jgi:hypothetical protein
MNASQEAIHEDQDERQSRVRKKRPGLDRPRRVVEKALLVSAFFISLPRAPRTQPMREPNAPEAEIYDYANERRS